MNSSNTATLLQCFASAIAIFATIPLAVSRWRSWLTRKRIKDAVANATDETVFETAEEDSDSGQDVSSSGKEGKRDSTHYSIDGEGRYGKGLLVQEIIRRYAAAHPAEGFNDLMAVFPPELRLPGGNTFWGCFNKRSDAQALLDDTGYRRHFLKTGQIITLGDKTEIAVSNQWGIGNIGRFIDKARMLGFRIEEV